MSVDIVDPRPIPPSQPAMSDNDGIAMDTDLPPDHRGAVMELPDGIPGLTTETRFVLSSVAPDAPEDSLFQLLTCLDDDTSLVVTQPWNFFADYAPDIDDGELEQLGITSPDDLVLFCPVTLDSQAGCVYVNLLGPFVVNGQSMVGRQVVLTDRDWPVRARVDLSAL